MESVNMTKSNYPINLLLRVEGVAEDGIEVTDDIISGVIYAIGLLEPREQEIVRYRYREGMTLKQIGELQGVSGSAIREIEMRALRKLRHPSRHCYIRNGLNGVMDNRAQKEYQRGYDAGMKDGYAKAIADMKDAEEGKKIKQLDTVVLEMNISIRAKNCLFRSGYRTVGDIINLSTEEIRAIRSMGFQSSATVAKALQAMNITETGWDFFL